MANDCNILTPLQRDGTSRANRSISNLQPSSILIDGRTMADFAQYVSQLSSLIQFYDEKNTASGNWQPFFKDDVSFLTAQIAKTNIQTYADEYTVSMRLEKSAIATQWAGFFTPTLTIVNQLDTWFRQSTEGVSIHAALYRLNLSVLVQATTQLVAIAKQGAAKGLPLPSINGVSMVNWVGSLSFGTSINYALIQPDKSILQETDPAKMSDDYDIARKKLKTIFDRVYQAIVGIVHTAPQYLEDSLQNYPQHKPHIALFWAFLKLLEYPQTDMNALSAKHLDFYYRDVLQLKSKAAIPDSVHAVFELARNFFNYEIAKGTYLKDGKDSLGVDILFKTDKTLVLNNIALDTEGVKNVFVETETVTINSKAVQQVKNIYAAPKADTDDGIAMPPTNGQWRAFGNTEMPPPIVGFAIASPQLLLQEGTRTITFVFRFKNALTIAVEDVTAINTNVIIAFTGKKGWITADISANDTTVTWDGTQTILTIKIKIDATKSAVVDYTPSVHGSNFTTNLPVAKFIFDNKSGSYPYKYFQQLGRLMSLDINVGVVGMKNLILENDLGVVNPAKPFMPFGSQPKVGNSFYIGSHEVFSKKLDSLDLIIEWGDLPKTAFLTHYDHYEGKPQNNNDFKVNSELLKDGEWALSSSDMSLFQANNNAPPSAVNPLSIVNRPDKRELFLEPFDTFSPSLLRGGIRLKLKTDFFHGQYPTVLISGMNQVPLANKFTPNLPYTPLITSFSIDYTSKETIDFKNDYSTQPEQLFQIHPFGTAEMYPSEKNGSIGNVLLSNTIVPQFLTDNDKTVAQGTFYVGLKNVHAAAPNEDQIVSILFQVAEGSEDPNTTPLPKKQPIKWSYLVNNEWKRFLDTQIISDTTNSFLKSGIIQFNLPAAMNSVNTVLKQGTFWLKAAIELGTAGVCRMVAVHPQAVRSTFENIGNDLNRVAKPLDGNAIGRLKERVAEVKKVLQPYPSFGGRATEADAFFYERVSERLRHKQRAVTMWDYEHLVLEAFPEVYKVRCIPHAKPLSMITETQLLESEYRVGFVTLIAVPNLRNQNAYNPLRPTLSKNKLSEIQAFLQQIANDFVEIAVHSPVFETIYTEFRVAFKKDYDAGFYKNKLNGDIIKFLSPWIYNEGIELSFGGKIHRSTILNFVEQREYVDFVDNFKLFHQGQEVENAVASTSASVLIPDKASLFVIDDAVVKECTVFKVSLECS